MEDTLPKTTAISVPRPSKTFLDTSLFVAQRLAFGLLILICIIYLSYLGLDMARGNDFLSAAVAAIWDTLEYIGNLLQGDLGVTAAGSITLRPIPISEVVATTLPKSLGLLGASLLTATVIGVIMGLIAARYRHSSGSVIILMASIIGISAPSFFVALLLQLLVINITQTTGERLLPVGGFGWDSHIILPMLVLATRPIAQITRVTFVAIGEIFGEDFIRTAHSKGIRPAFVLSNHVIRNAAIPILTTIGISLRFSLSSLPVVEFFFGWNGVGFTLLKSIARQDDNLTVTLLLCLGILFVLVNLLLELSYRFIDPRLRQTPAHIDRESDNAVDTFKGMLSDFWQSITDSRLARRFKKSAETNDNQELSKLTHYTTDTERAADRAIRAERRRKWYQATFRNMPLVVGVILVVGLIFIIVFGPGISPHSPYTTQGLVIEMGQISTPPFPPDTTYPWGTDVLGRDIMSLIIGGAQQTLILAVLVMLARMLVGFVLGAIAGWKNGHWIDRAIMGAAEIISAFPTLLLAMLLVLALGIRQGMRPFIIALCFVGWGEIMQFVRSEVTGIRPKLFIESAVAIGLRSPRIILSHVVPNLVPTLISLAALEMAAVLMLMGELGFIGIFIGGGAFAELEWQTPLYHYSDVPEWGALLSNIRTYARSHYWMAVYPSLAFFIAILGFNLMGEGLRRMVDKLGVGITRLINRYTVGGAIVLFLIVGWVQQNTGAAAFYREQALQFSGQHALTHIQNFTTPDMQNRAIGTDGLDIAADYIANEFRQLGLQAAGEDFTYFQTRKRDFGALADVPQLAIEDGGQPPAYRQDFAEFPYTYYRNWGQAEAPVQFLAVDELSPPPQWQVHPVLADLNLANKIVLVSSPQEASMLRPVPRAGILVVADDETQMNRYHTLSARDPNINVGMFGNREELPELPILWVSEDTANRMLAGTGQTMNDLRFTADRLNIDETYQLSLPVTASMNITGTVEERQPVRNIIGHLPGVSADLDKNMIIVMAQYDSPPLHPTENYPMANNNASSIGLMLEIIRTMQETNYQPYKTFLFVAYTAEGQQGGEPVYPPDISKFLDAKFGFSEAFDIEAVVHLRGLGAGSGDGLAVNSGGSTRLGNLFETAAEQVGVNTIRTGEEVDLGIVFEDRALNEGGQEAPQVELNWQGWEETSRLSIDTVDTISEDKLEEAGRALSLALMILGRETQY